jgi:methionyl-tRNA formyltransferase
MRVVMFGFQTWGRKTLRALIDLDHEVVLAVTHPASEHSYRGGHVGPHPGRSRASRGRVLPARRVSERPDLIRRK